MGIFKRILIGVGIAYAGFLGLSLILFIGASLFHAGLPWVYRVLF